MEKELDQKDLIEYVLKNIRQWKNADYVRPNSRAHTDFVTEIRLPKEGGVYVHFEKQPFPQKGFPYHDTVEAIKHIKKVFMGLAYGFFSFRGKWLIALFGLLFRKRIIASFTKLAQNLHAVLDLHMMIPIRYCNSVRELYHAFDEKDWLWRDMICMILEFDDAYRYRFQYGIGEIDPVRFGQNQLKELQRVLTLMVAREKDQRLAGTWRMMKRLLTLVFFFKDVRYGIVGVLSRVDVKNIKMDEGDEYYAKLRHNY